jgi:NhaA family Na+:H+ antiporter
MPGGTLHPWRRAVAPVVGAFGGIVGAIGMFSAFIGAGDDAVLAQGWPAACAVDVLFALAIARAIFRRSAAATFLLLLAIATDVVGLALISRRYPVAAVHPVAALLIVPALFACALLRHWRVRSIWPYLSTAAPLSWLACHALGIHPALALLPIVPFFPHTPRDIAIHPRTDLVHAAANHFEHVFERPVQAIAFLFGIVNGGVLLRGFGSGTWAILLASLVGRPVGILAALGAAAALGLRAPRHLGARELVVLALAASPALSFGVFFATAVFPAGPPLVEMKIGALATVVGLLPALLAAYLFRVGRFGDAAIGRAPVSAPAARRRA